MCFGEQLSTNRSGKELMKYSTLNVGLIVSVLYG